MTDNIEDYVTTAELARILDSSHEYARGVMVESEHAFKFRGAWVVPRDKVSFSMLPDKGMGREPEWNEIEVFDI